jgi:hypothetical protein
MLSGARVARAALMAATSFDQRRAIIGRSVHGER